jgi:gamma-glutamylputrescine oxidase
MLSFWEKQHLLQYDYLIAGSGIVGLSAALSLKEQAPNARILVLEKDILPTGASTKNAGFACIGSLTELLADLKTLPAEEVIALLALRRKGLQLLRKRVGDAHMDYHENGSYELIGEAELPALQQLDEMNRLLWPVLEGPAFTQVEKAFGFNPGYVKALVQNNYEGELNTGKMMRRLIDLAIEKGVEIKTGCNINQIEDTGSGVAVTVSDITFTAKALGICTNAFTKQLIPDIHLTPGRGQVLITSVIPDLPFKGVFHMDEGYYYFRELEGRVLFGGGRNLDFATEATTSFDLNPQIQQQLENRLHDVILPAHTFTITDRWTGIMAFGDTRKPLIQKYSPNIALGVRMGGMGVAIGSTIGEKLANLLLQ